MDEAVPQAAALPVTCNPHETATADAELDLKLRGVSQPKVDFRAIRRRTLDAAFTDAGFAEQGGRFEREVGGMLAQAGLERFKYGGSFRVWFELVPPVKAEAKVAFCGAIGGLEGDYWWIHGLDRASIEAALASAAHFVAEHFEQQLGGVAAFCHSVTPDRLTDRPDWLSPVYCDAVLFARLRAAEGRRSEAAAFARAALVKLVDDSPLGRLRGPSAIELEMHALLND